MTAHSLAQQPPPPAKPIREQLAERLESARPPSDPMSYGLWLCAKQGNSADAAWAELGHAYIVAGWSEATFRTRYAEKLAEVARAEFETSDGRTKIIVSPAVHESLDKLDDVLARRGSELAIYAANRRLVELVPSEDGVGSMIAEIAPACLAGKVSRIVQFVAPTKKDEAVKRPIAPPRDLMADLSARKHWPGVRPLRGLVTCPTLRPDLTVLDRAGYDAATGLFFDPAGQTFLAVPTSPTPDDIRRAVATLKDLLIDFPFQTAADLAAAVGLALRLLAGPAITGPTPFQVVYSHSPRVGKSLLLQVLCVAVLGRSPSSIAYTPDSEELRKRLFSIALKSSPIAILDNLPSGGAIGDPVLDAVLTATRIEDRVLGVSRMEEIEWRSVLAATGNNGTFKADTAARVQLIRLQTDLERPEQRTGFVHQQPKYAQAQRAAVVAAGLTILRGFAVAGCPDQRLPEWGSFESFSHLIRGALVWAGFEDPIAARVPAAQDVTRDFISRLLGELVRIDPAQRGKTTGELLTLAQMHRESRLAEILEGLVPPAAKLSAVVIGRALTAHVGRVVDGRRLVSKRVDGYARWFADSVAVDAGPKADARRSE